MNQYTLLTCLAVLLASPSWFSGQPFLPEQIHCPERVSIDPCTCENYPPKDETKGKRWVQVTCQRMMSFKQVIEVLQNKFSPNVQIMLSIEYSVLDDIGEVSFKNLNASLAHVRLSKNGIIRVPHQTFEGIGDVKFLSLGENKISVFPGDIFQHMPNIETLEISRTLIKEIYPTHFVSLKHLSTLIFSECNLTYIGTGTFPATLTNVHLGSNNLTSLNRTLSYQKNINIVQMQNNHIKTLEGELPDYYLNSRLKYLDISGNELDRLPETFKNLQYIDHLLAYKNKITSLDNALSKMTKLVDLDVSENRIHTLSPNEFAETRLETLVLANNEITSLNRSLLPLRHLVRLNATYNKLTEFSVEEIKGLKNLEYVDFSFNKIKKIIGNLENMVERHSAVKYMTFAHNELELLEGSLSSIEGLHTLNLSCNRLNVLPGQFLQGLDQLEYLDISHNRLHSLQETSKIILPMLTELKAEYNEINTLGEDLDGFPMLCWAYFSHNKIRTIKIEFTEKTECKVHGVPRKLRIYIDGNPALCDDTMKDVVRAIEIRKNNTEFHGSTHCSPPKEELKYTVNNTDSSPITVITLDKK